MPRSPIRLLLLRAKIDRLLQREAGHSRPNQSRIDRLRRWRAAASDGLGRAGFPKPVI